ncbi:AraC family transcriptional regulator [Stenotrophomonas sp.]|uniref:AraC family transcriptional regulator n=1 Tax=Stenotrophomonas sp. TaxID=69392 RepID=UPI0028AED0AA|nr:AraC family transcriptional regulator [Stenotrophomonas sp.]
MHADDSLSFRSYGGTGHGHRHAHVQLVLPLHGMLELEIEGRGGRLDLQRAALVAPGALHVQQAQGRNRFVIVDCDASRLDEAQLEAGRQHPFFALPPAARHLLAYVEHMAQGRAQLVPAVTRQVLPLLLDAALAPGRQCREGRLQALCERIRLAPGQDWPLARMASEAGLGLTALHAAFRRELDCSPAQWLQRQRLEWAQQRLAEGLLPLARIAQQAGYSDQSALTRAMRRELGVTPGHYRRQLQA